MYVDRRNSPDNQELALKLRDKRVDGGALVANKLKISFVLDDQGRPLDVMAESRKDANSLVEEFMLLANTAVSQVIAHGLPEQSLLRRHEAPIDRRLDGFVKRAKKLGFEMDRTSAGTLQKSFDKVQDRDEALCLELLKKKSMQS
jgi:protein SSD1